MGQISHTLNPLSLLEATREERVKIIDEIDELKDTLKSMDKKVVDSGLMLTDVAKNNIKLRLDIIKVSLQASNLKIQSLGTLVELKMLLDEIKNELKHLQAAANAQAIEVEIDDLYRDPTAARGTKGPRKKPPGRPKLSEEEKKRRKELREARMKQAALEEELRKNG